MHWFPYRSVITQTNLRPQQLQERLSAQMEAREVFWPREPKAKPFVGTVTATTFEIGPTSVYRHQWITIFVAGDISEQRDGSSIYLNFQTNKSIWVPLIWFMGVGLFILVCSICGILSANFQPPTVFLFLLVPIIVFGLPYIIFMKAYNLEVENFIKILSKLLELREVKEIPLGEMFKAI